MDAKPKFNVIYSEEVIDFLNSLPAKTKAKIMLMLVRLDTILTQNYSRNWWGLIFGNSEHCITVYNTDYWPFGITIQTRM